MVEAAGLERKSVEGDVKELSDDVLETKSTRTRDIVLASYGGVAGAWLDEGQTMLVCWR